MLDSAKVQLPAITTDPNLGVDDDRIRQSRDTR